MGNLLCKLAAGMLALSAASVAQADSFLPAGVTRTFSGTLQLGGSVTLSCGVSITVTTNATGSDAAVTAASISGGLCATLVPSGFPWNIDVLTPLPPPTNVTATTIQVSGVIVGGCSGTLVGTWSTSGPTIGFPAGTTLGACSVQGGLPQVSATPVLTVTN